jgi:hypothetical protein
VSLRSLTGIAIYGVARCNLALLKPKLYLKPQFGFNVDSAVTVRPPPPPPLPLSATVTTVESALQSQSSQQQQPVQLQPSQQRQLHLPQTQSSQQQQPVQLCHSCSRRSSSSFTCDTPAAVSVVDLHDDK